LPASTNYLQLDGLAGNIQFSPSGDWLAVSDENEVWLLNKEQFSTRSRILRTPPVLKFDSAIDDLIISPDSKWLGIATEDGEAILYNIGTKSRKVVSGSDYAPAIAFSSDSLRLITGGFEGAVEAWDVSSGESVSTLFDAGSEIVSLASGVDHLALGLEDKILVIDAGTGETILEVDSPGSHQLMAFSADGSLLAANNSSGQVYIWEWLGDRYTLLHNIPGEQASSMIFNPAGDRLYLGVLNNVYALDPLTGAEVMRIRHKDSVNDMSFLPDGNTLATASLKAIQFWDMPKIPQMLGDDLIKSACARLTQNFDAAQWAAFFGEEPYQVLCESLPVP
jgi:WD40 repeat protein